MTLQAEWVSTMSAQEASAALRAAGSVVVLTHSKPDGDALGGALALTRTLHAVGVGAMPVFMGPWPHRFDSIVADTPILRAGAAFDGSSLRTEPDLVVVLDTGAWSQLREVAEWLRSKSDCTMVIDHHLHGDPDVAARRLIDHRASAVCETLAEVCTSVLGIDGASALPVDVAEPLYLGIASDTGWFRHANVSASALRTAANLLDAGVSHSHVYQMAEQGDRVQRLLLIGRALNSLELHCDSRLAVSVLTQQDFIDCEAGPEDTGGFAEFGLGVSTVLVSAMLTESSHNRTKVSLRSKSAPEGGPAVDVNETAKALGGGGHAQAAGAIVEAEIEDVRTALIGTILDQLR